MTEEWYYDFGPGDMRRGGHPGKGSDRRYGASIYIDPSIHVGINVDGDGPDRPTDPGGLEPAHAVAR